MPAIRSKDTPAKTGALFHVKHSRRPGLPGRRRLGAARRHAICSGWCEGRPSHPCAWVSWSSSSWSSGCVRSSGRSSAGAEVRSRSSRGCPDSGCDSGCPDSGCDSGCPDRHPPDRHPHHLCRDHHPALRGSCARRACLIWWVSSCVSCVSRSLFPDLDIRGLSGVWLSVGVPVSVSVSLAHSGVTSSAAATDDLTVDGCPDICLPGQCARSLIHWLSHWLSRFSSSPRFSEGAQMPTEAPMRRESVPCRGGASCF